MNMRGFRQLVQAATEIKHVHRYRALDVTVTQGASLEFPILSCDDDPDYDEDFDASAAAPECEVGSRVLGINFVMDLVPGSAGGEQMEWILFKSPDGLLNNAITIPDLFTNDQTALNMLLRKYCLVYGRFLSTASKESSRTTVKITRAAMRRAGVMHDNDTLRMRLTHTAAASNGSFSLHGRIWTRK